MAKDRTDGADATNAIAGPALDPGGGWQASPDQVRALVDAAPVAVVAVDGEGRIRLVNARAEELFGYGRYELTGHPIDILLPEQLREAHAGYRAGFFAQPFVRPMGLGRVIAARRKDGSEFAADCGLGFVDIDGETLAVAFVTDVTERRQAEEALRFTQFAVDRAGVACFLIDQDARFVYVNEAACRSLGYSREELLAMTVHDIAPEFPVEVWPDHWEQIRRRDSFTCESHHRAKDGRVFPVEVTVNHLEFGGREYNCAFAVDITERKQAEVALRFTQFAVDHAGITCLWTDQDARLVYVNDAACRSLGYTREELLRLTVHDIDLDFPVEVWRERWEELKRKDSLTVESRHRAKDGRVFPVEITASYLEFGGRGYNCAFAVDITERKGAEEALRGSERKFRTLAATTPVAVAIIQGASIVYANSAAAALLGCTLDELLARPPTDFIHPEERELLEGRAAARLQAEDVPSRYEARLLTKDGQERWVEVNSSLTEFEGKPAILGTAFDITDRKKAEQALRDSEAKFRRLAEAMPAPVVMLQGERFVYVNSAATELAGYSSDEFLAMGLRGVLHPEDAAFLEEQALARLRGERVPSRHEARVITKEGSERWIDIKASISEFDGRPAVLATIVDTTERKRAEKAVRESEERYRRLADASFEGVAIQGDGRILDANEALGRMFGYEVNELIGKRAADLAAPESREALRQRIRSLDERGFEVTGRRKDGSTFPLELRVRAVTYHGRDARVLALHDLTEHKVVMEAQRHAREELEGRVERRMANSNPYGLTFREFTVLHLVAEGKADKEIALELDIRTATAQKHISNILHKMNAASRTEAGVRAVREGLLD